MPPKSHQAAKGTKGKAKAVQKEEKKQQKVAKTQPKGKFQPFFSVLYHIIVPISEIQYCDLSIKSLIIKRTPFL